MKHKYTTKRCPSCGRDTGYGTFEYGDCPYCGEYIN